ncbi:MAG: prepilin-type N-terminal cleavage/methylation domain-containing protein [Burkholderiaceae bacterium]|nr:prepilin-type N-terminal cleavage/methylation domain-containing protein [Burkholderiaceae bacterium]
MTPPICASARRKGHRGFTLIELLVAIAVMALIAILSWRGLDGMVRAQETTRQRADEMLVLQAALGQWGADLDALMPLAGTVPLDWDGQVLRMTRRSSAVPDEGALVVAWTRRNAGGAGGGQWLRWQSPLLRTRDQWQQAWQQARQWASTPGEADRRSEVTLLPLESWQIFYYRGGAWSNPLSSTGTPDAPPSDGVANGAASAVPDGIRLQITLPPGQALAGQLTRDWVSPVLGGGRT